jgi:hypothetical protein
MPSSFPIDGTAPFWKALSPEDWHGIFETSRLEGDLLARYWRASEWQGPMPAYIEIQVRKSDIDRLIREIKKRP